MKIGVFCNPIKKETVNFTSQTIAANSTKELRGDVASIESGYIGGYQLYSLSPQSGNIVIRAIRIVEGKVYVYLYNHSSSSVTLSLAVDVIGI